MLAGYAVLQEHSRAGISDLERQIHGEKAARSNPHLHPVAVMVQCAQYSQHLPRKWHVYAHLSQFWAQLG